MSCHRCGEYRVKHCDEHEDGTRKPCCGRETCCWVAQGLRGWTITSVSQPPTPDAVKPTIVVPDRVVEQMADLDALLAVLRKHRVQSYGNGEVTIVLYEEAK